MIRALWLLALMSTTMLEAYAEEIDSQNKDVPQLPLRAQIRQSPSSPLARYEEHSVSCEFHQYKLTIKHVQSTKLRTHEFSSVEKVVLTRKGEKYDLTESFALDPGISIIRVDFGCYPYLSSQVVFLTTDFTDKPIQRTSILLDELAGAYTEEDIEKIFPEIVRVDEEASLAFVGDGFRDLE